MTRRSYFGVIEVASAGYGIYFPDFPGCASAADTLEQLPSAAAEALQLHIDGMVEDGDTVPLPSTPDLGRERTQIPEGDLIGLLNVEVQVPAFPDHVLVDVKSDLIREIVERTQETVEKLSARQFVESAVRHELDRLKKSA